MAIGLIIAAVDRTGYLSEGADRASNPKFTAQIGSRGRGSIDLIVAPGDTFQPLVGQTCSLYDGGTVLFGGSIGEISSNWYGQDGWVRYTVTIDSFEQALGKHLVSARAYFNKTCGYIVNDLLTTVASGELISAGTISAGPTLTSVVYDGSDNLIDALNALATTAGFIWYIDPTTIKLYFQAQTGTAAPFTLTTGAATSQVLWETIAAHQTRQDFRDRQRIRIGFAAFAPKVDYFDGDGTSTTLVLNAPVKELVSATQTGSGFGQAVVTVSGGPIVDGETVTIGSITYTFKTTIDNTVPFQILLDNVTADNNLIHLAEAISDTGVNKGTDYSWPTWLHPQVRAIWNGTDVEVVANYPGSAGNGIAISTTGGHFLPVSGQTAGGNDAADILDRTKDIAVTIGSATITINSPVPLVTFLVVSYRPLGGDILTVEDTALVSTRHTVETTTGLYEAIQDASSSTNPVSADPNAAIAQANGLLTTFKALPYDMSFETDTAGLYVGQYLPVSFAAPFTALNGNWLIRQIDAEYLPAYKWRYTVEIINVPQTWTWLNLWEKLAVFGTAGGGGGAGGVITLGPSPAVPQVPEPNPFDRPVIPVYPLQAAPLDRAQLPSMVRPYEVPSLDVAQLPSAMRPATKLDPIEILAFDSRPIIPNFAGGFPQGAWIDYTPTITKASGTGTLTSSTIQLARYLQAGKTVFIRVAFTPTFTGNIFAFDITLPVTANDIYNTFANCYDSNQDAGFAFTVDSTHCEIWRDGGAAFFGGVCMFAGTYEAA